MEPTVRRLLTADEKSIWTPSNTAPDFFAYFAYVLFGLLGLGAVFYATSVVVAMLGGVLLKLKVIDISSESIIFASLIAGAAVSVVAIFIVIKSVLAQKRSRQEDQRRLENQFDVTRFQAFGVVILTAMNESGEPQNESEVSDDCDFSAYVIDIGNNRLLYLEEYHCFELGKDANIADSSKPALNELETFRDLKGELFGAIIGVGCLNSASRMKKNSCDLLPESGRIVPGRLETLRENLKTFPSSTVNDH
jgi:hypothetical protein